MTLLDVALDLAGHGCSVVPVATDGTKRPAVAWKGYTTAAAAPEQLHTWFANGTYDGLGVITGAVSGNLEMLEVEGRATDLAAELGKRLTEAGASDLWIRLMSGYFEQSPSGGLHWLYRVDGAARPNRKLARRPATLEELAVDPSDKVKVLIETRGEGGFTVTAPSAGRSHPTGQPWRLLTGTPASIPVLTVEERDLVHACAAQLDQMPVLDAPPARPGAGQGHQDGLPQPGTGLRPGDDYNARAGWDDLLGPRGWTRGKRLGRGYGWTRPGKHARDGISATTGTADDGVDRLYVFSTSTEFESEVPYSKFGAYALLEHAGDHAAAAAALSRKGYGDPPQQPILSLVPGPVSQPTAVPVAVPTTATSSASMASTTPPTSAQPTGATDPVQGATVLQLRPDSTETLVRSEDGHAHQLIAAYGDLVRFCPERGLWLAWGGSRWEWQPKGGGIVREYAKNVARDLPGDSNAAVTHKRRTLSAAGITGCLKQAETDARVTVHMHQLDADPWTLNTPGGVVDLRTGEHRDPDPAALCTKTTTVAPALDPDPVWARFLDDTFADDAETRAYVQRLVGLTLVGQVREQLLAFLHGQGANGKSTLTKVLMRVLGTGETGYAVAAAAEMLMIRKHPEHPAEIAKLAGARMVVCSELDDSQRFNEARIKDLTGGDLMDARFLYGQPFTFTPTHTMWLYGNKRPQAHSGGMAFWRRVKLIELKHVVPTERRDPALDDKLYAAGGTVLAWAIAGAVDYLKAGIREPGGVADATAAYAADQDTVGRFVTEMCHRAETDQVRVQAGVLRTAYEAWCRETGETPSSAKRLGQELRDRFDVDEHRSNGRRFYTRICLLDVDHDPDEPDDDQPSTPDQEPSYPTTDAPIEPPDQHDDQHDQAAHTAQTAVPDPTADLPEQWWQR